MKIFLIVAIYMTLITGCVSTNESYNFKKDSNENLTLCNKGWNATEARDYSRAISLYDECIKSGNLTDASLARTYRNIGITYNRMQEYELAIKFYNKALEMKPKDIWSDYVNRGNAWDNIGQYKKAFTDYDLAIKYKKICNHSFVKGEILAVASPDCGQIFYNRGVSYEKQGKLKEARSEFQKAYNFGLRSELLLDRILVHRELLRRKSLNKK